MLALMTLASLFANPAEAAPQNYILTPNKSLLYMMVYKDDSALASLSHNHAVKAEGWSGKAVWDPENIGACKISLTLPVNSLKVDLPRVRKLAGLNNQLTVSQRADVKSNMLSEKQLWADKYSEIKFSSTSCSSNGNQVILKGTFSLRGKSNPISLPIKVSTDQGLKIEGKFKFNGSDYGLEPYTAMFGQLRNKDGMEVRLKLVGDPK